MANGKSLRIDSTDLLLYAIAVLAGFGIVAVNGFLVTTDINGGGSRLIAGMEQIITRMDAMQGQLSAWGAVDMRKDANF